jgi:hypothetical protein
MPELSSQTLVHLNRIQMLEQRIVRLELQNAELRTTLEKLSLQNHVLTVARELTVRSAIMQWPRPR